MQKVSFIGVATENVQPGCNCSGTPVTHLRVNSSGGEIVLAIPTKEEAERIQGVVDPNSFKGRMMVRFFARLAKRLYQVALSPLVRSAGVRCLHYPSCSEYARLAFKKHSFRSAVVLSWQRWRACNPFSGRPYIDWP